MGGCEVYDENAETRDERGTAMLRVCLRSYVRWVVEVV